MEESNMIADIFGPVASIVAAIIAAIFAYITVIANRTTQQKLVELQHNFNKDIENQKQEWSKELMTLEHRLEIERNKISEEIAVIQKIHSERFEALKDISYHQAELEHCVRHLLEGEDKTYAERLNKHFNELRQLARKHKQLFDADFEKAVYLFTDEAKTSLQADKFKKDAYFSAKDALDEIKNWKLKTKIDSYKNDKNVTINNKMTPIEASKNMTLFSPSNKTSSPWSSLLRYQGIGQIKSKDDWDKVPIDIELKAIFLLEDDGMGVIRWADPKRMQSHFGGPFHTHLLCIGDNSDGAKKGWIRISSSGEISVKG